jgi:hypothetical protein
MSEMKDEVSKGELTMEAFDKIQSMNKRGNDARQPLYYF